MVNGVNSDVHNYFKSSYTTRPTADHKVTLLEAAGRICQNFVKPLCFVFVFF